MLQLPRLTKIGPGQGPGPEFFPGPMERVPLKESNPPRSISNKTISGSIISALR